MDPRAIALIVMAHHARILDAVIAALPTPVQPLAQRRARALVAADPEEQAQRPCANPLLWAILAVFARRTGIVVAP
eukprot:m.141357 g.141357  ORF g.141357 m.141357 type:complete len:76 (-) comp9635_c0_seq6:199-426(-)